MVLRSGRRVAVASPKFQLRAPAACGCSSMVEPQPSKLMTRVRFPPPAPVGWRGWAWTRLQVRAADRPRAHGAVAVSAAPSPGLARCAGRRRMREPAGRTRLARQDKVCSKAHLAQSVEHTLGKGEVAGSIPAVGTNHSLWRCGIGATDGSGLRVRAAGRPKTARRACERQRACSRAARRGRGTACAAWPGSGRADSLAFYR